MKRSFWPVLAIAAVATLALAARPASELQLFSLLNGQPHRFVNPNDGGYSGLYGTGQQCMTVTGGDTFLIVPETPLNLCVRPGALDAGTGSNGVVSTYWDGGCNNTSYDNNFGEPLQPWQPRYLVTSAYATRLCGVSDAGTMAASIWKLF